MQKYTTTLRKYVGGAGVFVKEIKSFDSAKYYTQKGKIHLIINTFWSVLSEVNAV